MREETRSTPTICAICNKPITQEERPSVLLKSGDEVHVQCWQKQQQEASKPKPN